MRCSRGELPCTGLTDERSGSEMTATPWSSSHRLAHCSSVSPLPTTVPRNSVSWNTFFLDLQSNSKRNGNDSNSSIRRRTAYIFRRTAYATFACPINRRIDALRAIDQTIAIGIRCVHVAGSSREREERAKRCPRRMRHWVMAVASKMRNSRISSSEHKGLSRCISHLFPPPSRPTRDRR